MKITLRILALALLTSILISLFAWCWMVLHQFNIANPWTTLPMGLWQTFEHPSLRPIAWKALALGFIPMGFALYWTGDWSNDGDRVLRGAKLVTGKELAKRTRLKRRKDAAPLQVEIAGVPIPVECEPSHFLLSGSTNTGKSTAIDQLLATVIARGDRAIVIDPNGHALARFGKKGDTLLNPFDKRSPGGSLFNEIRKPYDFERLSKSVVPDSPDPNTQEWHTSAQLMLSETMRTMAQAGENTTERLLYWLTAAPAAELASFLVGSAASGLFQPGAEKALASTRFILTKHVGPYQHLRVGDFSLRNWLESSQGNLYITWREDMLDSLRPLVSGWVDILMASILILPTENPHPLWLVLDELASLERLGSLEAALTKGRKHGLRVVAGLQAVAQLDALYGRDNAKTLRSCFRNLLALGCSNADPETAKAISDGLGQIEIERMQTTYNQGQTGATTSKSSQRTTESLVLPSELTSLPPLHGYLKFAGDYPVAKVQLVPGNFSARIKPFKER
ncbi:type IV secretion system DNA-binding domain-containing protein [Denitratisoma oestradiolicum]|uniref:IncW plasmid conjugative protein TrwB (TraD homolog) n=1 Tax=Denitratisoma oestradiolicum TaxID=311182 RepID=A0A6S6XTJ8_9PROT|nr:type IV secretion system DNA-binding domain-containing protein [Denitratisoma oestradiolicum]TWO80237.1 hypothetical protein CBW56_10510 [Denitratisoma oestradiolicum]CAB1369325.1 IncW plasmid conjugative protein TrwB (TraD homolog) [Denitratisoma oestradiolicum]